MMRGKRKRISLRGNRLVGGSKRMKKLKEYGVFIPGYGGIEWLTNGKALQIAMLTKIIQSVGIVGFLEKGRFLHTCSISCKLERVLTATDADEVRFDLWVTSTLFPRNLVGVVKLKIHSSFRTGALQRNPHTLLPKLALVDTIYTPMARVVQIRTRSCFRTEVHTRNQHTLIPKLELVDTVYTPMARVLNL